jgi:hypothetical protein
MAAARRVATLHPAVRRAMAGYAGRSVRTNCFDPEIARSSLETSLRELRTDHVDLFLLHDADLENALTPGLFKFLEEARQSGKIRAFGCATGLPQTEEIIAGAPDFATVVQITNGFRQWSLDSLPVEPRFHLTHGALKVLPDLEAALSEFPEDDRCHVSRTGSELAGLLIGLSIHKNPDGITLFSSTHPDRIRENVKFAMNCESLTDDDWKRFQRIVEIRLTDCSAC